MKIRLIASTTGEAGGFNTTTDAEIVGVSEPLVNSAGYWSATLDPNTSPPLIPENTYYKVIETVPGRPPVESNISVPNGAGPYHVADILTVPLADLDVPLSANSVSFAPTGSLASTTVQDAIAEAASEAYQLSGHTLAAHEALGLPAYAQADLPAGANPGWIARVTNTVRGLWMRGVTQWFSLFGEVVNVKEFGAKGDGSTNDTQAILDATNSVAGRVRLYFPPGVYMINASLFGKTDQAWFGAGMGLSIIRVIAGTAAFHGIRIENITNFSMKDIEFDHNGATLTGADFHAIRAQDSNDLRFTRVRVRNGRAHGITVIGNSRNVWVEYSHLVNNGTQGNGSGFVSGFATTGDVLVPENIFLIGNLAEGNALEGLQDKQGRFVTYQGNICRNNGRDGICTAIDVTATSPPTAMGVTITGNICTDNTQVGIRVENTRLATVTGNSSGRNGREGVVVRNASNNVVQGNTIFENGQSVVNTYAGILVFSDAGKLCKDNLIAGNRIVDEQTTLTQSRPWVEGTVDAGSTDRNHFIGNHVIGNISTTPTTIAGGTRNYFNRGYQPVGPGAITVGASPYTYTNTDRVPEMVYISGGTVSSVVRGGITVFTSTNCAVWLEPSETVVVTYSSLPVMVKDRK